ncbi:MAG: Fur family transcriptional regulator [Phycisphaerales bacterium]
MANIREVLDRNGLRCTRQREVIFNALESTKTHPTAEELFHRVREVEPGLSLATVYNTLDALSACGLVRRLPCPSGTGPCRFDADTDDHVHIATAEGTILDTPHDLSERLISSIPPEVVAELERRMGVRVRGLSIQVVAERDGEP